MRIVFRSDSSYQIGTGHIMRCLNLAKQMKTQGATCQFLSRSYPNNLNQLIKKLNFDLLALPVTDQHLLCTSQDTNTWLGYSYQQDIDDCLQAIKNFNQTSKNRSIDYEESIIDLLIIDHYGIDYQWEQQIKKFYPIKEIMVIDDIFNRNHYCDYLLDHSFYSNNPYQKLMINPDTKFFLGPQFAMVDLAFWNYRKTRNPITGLNRIQISFGGTDIGQQTIKVLKLLIKHFPDLIKRIEIDIILGIRSASVEEINKIASEHHNINLYQSVPIEKMAELLSQTDLVIGGGGVSSYERCCLGVPSIVITVADNQVPNTKILYSKGIIKYLGMYYRWKPEDLISAINNFCQNQELLKYQKKLKNR